MFRSKSCRQVACPKPKYLRDIACIFEENLEQGLLWFGNNVAVYPRIGGGDRRLCFCQYIDLTGNIVISDNVTAIGNYAFQNSAFKGTLHIGESVHTIGEYAFNGCKGTGDIIIPDNVTSLGAYAFYKCTGFKGNLNIGTE